MEIRILKTTEQDFAQKWSTIKKRGGVFNDDVLQSVGEILHLVKTQGDAGLRKLAKRFGDLATGEEDLLVAKNEIDLAANKASRADILALKKAYRRIKEYHQKQVTTGYTCEKEPGVLL
ncbi:MAG: histidinol dehydrogenase, partial [Deltaproteobacteria bacterium]|nr:histidinol dehydrogenase [Deltaproteobacteria bacterium]